MVTELTTENFNTFLGQHKFVVVDFWAEWCGPCKVMAPVFEELSKELEELKFAKLNVDDEAEVAQTYEVQSIPTLIVFHNGEEVGRSVGFMPKAVIKTKIKEAMQQVA